MDKIKLTPLGGLYEFGNQSYLYRVGNTSVLVDAGAFFDDSNPDLANTRIMPDYNMLKNFGKLSAILITHNHEDHLGGITYLLKNFPKVPIYCTHFVGDNILMRARVEGIEIPDLYKRIHRVMPYETTPIRDNFKVEFLPVDHSVPGASMIYIETDDGNILHTGDWRYDKTSNTLLWQRLQKLRKYGMLAVVADSTGIDNNRNDLYSERQIYDGLERVFIKNRDLYKNFVFATFSTHVDRVRSICKLARRYTHKNPLFLGTGLLVNQTVAVHQKMLPLRAINIAKNISAEEGFYIATGSQAEPGSFLMELTRCAKPIDKPTCIVISASEIPSRKEKIHNMIDILRRQGYKVICNDKENLTHMSGHATCSDMEKLVETVCPEIYIPVHGEGHHLKSAEEMAKQLNVPEVKRFSCVGETITMGNHENTSIHKEFTYNKITDQKKFNAYFVQSLRQHKRI